MSSWISRATENRNAQLVTTAVVSGVVVASAILGLQKAKRMYRVADLKASIPDVTDDHHSTRVSVTHPSHRTFISSKRWLRWTQSALIKSRLSLTGFTPFFMFASVEIQLLAPH